MATPMRYPVYTVHFDGEHDHATALSWGRQQGLKRIMTRALALQFPDVSRHQGRCFALDTKRLVLFSKDAIDAFEFSHPGVARSRVDTSEVSGTSARSWHQL